MADAILKNTMEGTGEVPQERTLPETTEGNLSVFKRLLQTVTQRAKQKATASGLEAVGVEPSKVSGGTLSSVIDLVKGQKTTGIKDIYTQTIDMLKEQQEQTDKQLQTLISSGGIAQLDDATINKLAAVTDYPVEYLQSIKAAKMKSKSETKLTEAERKRAAIAEMAAILTAPGVQGEDGFISPKDYIEKRAEWVKLTQYTPQEFDEAFSYLVNQDYVAITEEGEEDYNPYKLIED